MFQQLELSPWHEYTPAQVARSRPGLPACARILCLYSIEQWCMGPAGRGNGYNDSSQNLKCGFRMKSCFMCHEPLQKRKYYFELPQK